MDTESQTEELLTTDGRPDDSWSARDILLAIGAFVIIAAIAVGGFFFYESRQAPPLKDGVSAAPDFTLPLLGGGQASLSDYKGQVVLLNIWATWCNPCRTEMPSMQRLSAMMKGKSFTILASSIDNDDPGVQQFVKEYGLTFPILLDRGKDVSSLYQTTGVPESLIIDKNGIIQKRIIGPAQWDDPNSNEYQLIQHLIVSQ